MLAAVGLVGAGGIADLIHSLATGGKGKVATSTLTTSSGKVTPPMASSPTPPTSTPPTKAAVAAKHPTPTHAQLHHAQHHGAKHHGKKKHEEPAKLPPLKLRPRSHPAYQVSDLIPNPPKHAIALTIDDGPDPEWTPKVLRLLDRLHMQASFCVVGVHADAYPRMVRDVVKAGHVVVNHSYTHMLPFNELTQKRIVWEITKTQHAIEKASGFTPQLFRAPGGDWSKFILKACAAYGLEPLDWDVDPRDWARPGTKVVEKRMLHARPGEIVLCHDGGGDRGETVRALRKVLPTWKHRGYDTITLHVTPHFLNTTPQINPSGAPAAGTIVTPTTGPTS
jgi:peptidoglycan/xylan/chitin deacetylase (PgdA/CDA1 family)